MNAALKGDHRKSATGDVDAALKAGGRVIRRDYRVPFLATRRWRR
jgi:hypothetical protein